MEKRRSGKRKRNSKSGSGSGRERKRRREVRQSRGIPSNQRRRIVGSDVRQRGAIIVSGFHRAMITLTAEMAHNKRTLATPK